MERQVARGAQELEQLTAQNEVNDDARRSRPGLLFLRMASGRMQHDCQREVEGSVCQTEESADTSDTPTTPPRSEGIGEPGYRDDQQYRCYNKVHRELRVHWRRIHSRLVLPRSWPFECAGSDRKGSLRPGG